MRPFFSSDCGRKPEVFAFEALLCYNAKDLQIKITGIPEVV